MSVILAIEDDPAILRGLADNIVVQIRRVQANGQSLSEVGSAAAHLAADG